MSRGPQFLLAVAGLCGSASALAGPADYQCPGGHTLTASFTARDAVVKWDGRPHTLRRVRDSDEARFVNPREALTLTIARSQATWEQAGAPAVVCRKKIESLQPERLYGHGASAPARP